MIEPDRESLDRLRDQTEEAENEGDVSFFEGVAADDIIVMPPNSPAVVGRAATVAFMREFLSQFNLQIRYASEEIQVYGRIAFNRGTYAQTLTLRSGGAPLQEKGSIFGCIFVKATGPGNFHASYGMQAS